MTGYCLLGCGKVTWLDDGLLRSNDFSGSGVEPWIKFCTTDEFDQLDVAAPGMICSHRLDAELFSLCCLLYTDRLFC